MGLLDRLFGRRSGKGDTRPPRAFSLEDLREPAIWLARTESANTRSRLGGVPSLPDRIEWPRQTVSNTPLHFLAQIDLSTLPPTPLDPAVDDARLPSRGMLFFFADIEEEMLWGWGERGDEYAATRVIFAASPGADRAPPGDMPEVGHVFGEPAGGYARGIKVFPARPLLPHVIDTFAGVELYFQGAESKRADELTMASIERATGEPVPVLDWNARDGIERYPAAWVRSRSAPHETPTREARIMRHQMLGAATNVQGTAAGARNADHVLLLQLDSDFGVDRSFMFCDMGMAQYWIRREDLAAGRFERAWATTEGG